MRRGNADPRSPSQNIEREPREIRTVFPAVRWRVHVRARVRHHLDPSDLERGPGRVERPGSFTTEVVSNDRAGQALVRDHPCDHRVAEVEKARHAAILPFPEAPAAGWGAAECLRVRATPSRPRALRA